MDQNKLIIRFKSFCFNEFYSEVGTYPDANCSNDAFNDWRLSSGVGTARSCNRNITKPMYFVNSDSAPNSFMISV